MRDPFAEEKAFRDWLGAQWADNLRLALENMCATSIPVEHAAPLEGGAITGSDWLWFQQSLVQAPRAPFWLGAPSITWRRMAGRILEAAGIKVEGKKRSARPISRSFRTPSARWPVSLAACGDDITCGESNLAPAAPPLPWLQFTLGADLGTPIFLAFSPTLRESLAKLAAPASAPRVPAAVSPGPAPPISSKIEVLYEVELPVSISFGCAHSLCAKCSNSPPAPSSNSTGPSRNRSRSSSTIVSSLAARLSSWMATMASA